MDSSVNTGSTQPSTTSSINTGSTQPSTTSRSFVSSTIFDFSSFFSTVPFYSSSTQSTTAPNTVQSGNGILPFEDSSASGPAQSSISTIVPFERIFFSRISGQTSTISYSVLSDIDMNHNINYDDLQQQIPQILLQAANNDEQAQSVRPPMKRSR